jgi:hypothetical protein
MIIKLNRTGPIDKFEIILYYGTVVIPILGVIANFICTFIFITILRTQSNNNSGHMFKFLLGKSICDALNMIISSLYIFFSDNNSVTHPTYIAHFYYLYFFIYTYNVLVMISTYFEILATIDCYLIISKKWKFFQKNSIFYLLCFIVIILSALAPLYYFFKYEIVLNTKLNLEYEQKTTSLVHSKFYKCLVLALLIPRDILSLIILLITNVFILFELKKSTRRRRILNNGHSSTMIDTALIAEKKKVYMILCASLIYLLHIPSLLQKLDLSFISSLKYYFNIKECLMDLSLSISIVPYIIFNNTFKKFFYKFILFFKCNR